MSRRDRGNKSFHAFGFDGAWRPPPANGERPTSDNSPVPQSILTQRPFLRILAREPCRVRAGGDIDKGMLATQVIDRL